MAEALNEAAARSPHPHLRRLPSPAERRGGGAATEYAARLRRIITEMYGE